jgi:hypothetical protein
MKKIDVPEYELLNNLYTEEKKSLIDIATICNTSAMTVRSWLNNLGIEIKQANNDIYKELRYVSLGDHQKSIIIGSLLGDGSLRIPKRGKNAHFYEKHSVDQEEYLHWKYDNLKPFSIHIHRELGKENHNISGVACSTKDSVKLTTTANSDLTKLWKLWYKGNGNKIIPHNLDDYFNKLILAVWICDDGSLVWNSIRRTYRLDIHTESFSYKEQVRLVESIYKLFKGTILIIPRQYISGEKFYLSLRNKVALHELCISLKQYVPECMWYKFKTSI